MNLIEAAKEVVSRWDTPSWKDVPATAEYINRLRAAIEEAEKQEPVAWVCNGQVWFDPLEKRCAECEPLYSNPPQIEQQEPVAWISAGGNASRSKKYMDEMGFKCEPLYPAPAVPSVNWLAEGTPPKYTPGKSSPPSSSIPGGWQLVPKEPTFEMIHAGTPSTEGHYSLPVSLYKSMLAAAPKFGEKE